jgi:hypothetical protein
VTQTIFLSTVTSEFGALRRRLAEWLQRTKRVHVRHQDDFFHHGVKTLRMLEEEVAASELVIHVIGREASWCPPLDQVEDFLRRHDDFTVHFPELKDLAKAGAISATQWEVWLALYFNIKSSKDIRVLIFEFPDRFELACSQQQHSKRLHDTHHHPKTVASDDVLYDEILLSLFGLGLLTEQDVHPPHLPTNATSAEKNIKKTPSNTLIRPIAFMATISLAFIGYSLSQSSSISDNSVPESKLPEKYVVELQVIDPTAAAHLDSMEILESFFETGIPTAPKLLECLFIEINVEPSSEYTLQFPDNDTGFPVHYAVLSKEAAFVHTTMQPIKLSQDISSPNPGTKELRLVTSESAHSVKCYFKFYYNSNDQDLQYNGRLLTVTQSPNTYE